MMIMTLFSEMLVSLLITLFTNTSTDSGVSSILYYAGGVMLSKMVLFSILKLVQFIIPSIGERIPGYLMVPLLMLPVASFLMTWVLGEYTLRDGASTLTYIAIGALVMPSENQQQNHARSEEPDVRPLRSHENRA